MPAARRACRRGGHCALHEPYPSSIAAPLQTPTVASVELPMSVPLVVPLSNGQYRQVQQRYR
jgi:hypothetical protein